MTPLFRHPSLINNMQLTRLTNKKIRPNEIHVAVSVETQLARLVGAYVHEIISIYNINNICQEPMKWPERIR